MKEDPSSKEMEDLKKEVLLLKRAIKHLENSAVDKADIDEIHDTINSNELKLEKVVSSLPKFQNFDKSLRSIGEYTKHVKVMLEEFSGFIKEKEGLDQRRFGDIVNGVLELETFVSKCAQCSNVQTELEKLNNKISNILRENFEFEKTFSENFSSLCHVDGSQEYAPGFVLSKNKSLWNAFNGFVFGGKSESENIENKMIELKFKNKKEINDPVRKNITCARVLTVEGDHPPNIEEVTVLIVGVTGAGKSTLIDAIANFYYNVRYEDRFRLKLVDLLDKEKEKSKNQAVSQTDEITVYKLPWLKYGNAPQLRLTIIDTPGVADTRGLEKDDELVKKLCVLFESGKIPKLNAICLVSNAGNPRLTAYQQYVFDSLITNFGKDLSNNIVGLFTFDDGAHPKALDAFRAAKIGLSSWFKFNSISMLETRTQTSPVTKTIMMTEEARKCVHFQQFYKNCDNFLGTLVNMDAVTTVKSAQVMKQRMTLDEQRYILNNKLSFLLAKKEEVRQHEDILRKFQNDKDVNKDFKHETDVVDQVDTQLPEEGYFVTNCTACLNAPSCHDKCIYENDADKEKCSAMNKDGYCRMCKCYWNVHRNMKYKLVVKKSKKLISVKEIEERYNQASANCKKQSSALDNIKNEQQRLSNEFQQTVVEIRDIIIQLDRIAMKTAPTDSASYIEQMIATEKMNQEPGYEERVKELQEEKKNAEILDTIIHGGDLGGHKLKKMRLQNQNLNVSKIDKKQGYEGFKVDKDGLKAKQKEYEKQINSKPRLEKQGQELFKKFNKSTIEKTNDDSNLLLAMMSDATNRIKNIRFPNLYEMMGEDSAEVQEKETKVEEQNSKAFVVNEAATRIPETTCKPLRIEEQPHIDNDENSPGSDYETASETDEEQEEQEALPLDKETEKQQPQEQPKESKETAEDYPEESEVVVKLKEGCRPEQILPQLLSRICGSDSLPYIQFDNLSKGHKEELVKASARFIDSKKELPTDPDTAFLKIATHALIEELQKKMVLDYLKATSNCLMSTELKDALENDFVTIKEALDNIISTKGY